MAKQISAPYIECSAQQSENSVRDIFHVATLACINKNNKNVKRSKAARGNKRISHMPGRPDLAAVASDLRKDKAKSCSVMWLIRLRRIRLRTRTEHSASRKLRGSALSCMLKTPYLSGEGFYKLQLMYMLLEYSAPMKTQCVVASQPTWPPAPPDEEAIRQRATCSGKWPRFLRDDGVDAVEAFHGNRKWAGGVMSLRRCSFVKKEGCENMWSSEWEPKPVMGG